jgi:hypothetical protein
MSSNQVVSVGIATIDNIVRVERFPEENERVLALENLTSVGGLWHDLESRFHFLRQ